MNELLFDDSGDEDRDAGDIEDEVKDLMKNHYLDKDEAKHVKEIMDEYGLYEDDSVELKDVL